MWQKSYSKESFSILHSFRIENATDDTNRNVLWRRARVQDVGQHASGCAGTEGRYIRSTSALSRGRWLPSRKLTYSRKRAGFGWGRRAARRLKIAALFTVFRGRFRVLWGEAGRLRALLSVLHHRCRQSTVKRSAHLVVAPRVYYRSSWSKCVVVKSLYLYLRPNPTRIQLAR